MDIKRCIDLAVRFIRAGKRAYARKWTFLFFSAFIFCGNVVVLGTLDLLPEAPSVSATSTVVLATDPRPAVKVNTPVTVIMSELPVQIEIPAINLTASIANPTTAAVEVLDQYLLKGAVRYPTSAKLGETGNVVLFGHSSYLPVVRNQAYKTFNDIQKLVAGDMVTVYSSGTAHTYQVRSVAKESAASNGGIPLEIAGRVLTLVTCNSFATKSDRFVVTADFVESHPVSSQG